MLCNGIAGGTKRVAGKVGRRRRDWWWVGVKKVVCGVSDGGGGGYGGGWFKWKRSNSSRQQHPPVPTGSWPIIGHLHHLRGIPHITLGRMADKYGPIFMIKLGVNRALVVSSHTTAKECLGVNERVFTNRPKNTFVEHLTYNSAMFAFSQHGPYWRDIRKISTSELLSNHRPEMFKDVRISEVRSAIKDAYDVCCANNNDGGLVDLKQWFHDISLNTMVRLIAGKSLKENYKGEKYEKISEALRDFFELAGVFVHADALPFLRWFDFGGYKKTMKKVAKEMDQVVHEWLEQHKQRIILEKGKVTNQDFMDAMLGLYESDKDRPTEFEADTVIKATCMNMILAGTDTTTMTLIWALSLLLNNRDVMKKAQAEIDEIVDR